jgi:hypothetical protein
MEVVAVSMHWAAVVHGLPALPEDLRRALVDYMRRSDRLTPNALAHLLHPAHQRTACTPLPRTPQQHQHSNRASPRKCV